MTTTFERLQAILVKDYKLAPDKLTPEASLDEIGIDSLALFELLFNVEEEFKIALPSEQVQLPTVGHVVRYIDELIAAQRGGNAAAPDPGAP